MIFKEFLVETKNKIILFPSLLSWKIPPPEVGRNRSAFRYFATPVRMGVKHLGWKNHYLICRLSIRVIFGKRVLFLKLVNI